MADRYGPLEIVSMDTRMVDLGNEVSDAVHKALESGLEADVVCSALINVIADYWIVNYPRPCTALCDIFRAKERQRGMGGGA